MFKLFKQGPRISFLVIGAQKGGTTALNHFLEQHPQIGLGKRKEIHFFDNDDLFAGKPDYNGYHVHFDFSGKKDIYGEATPAYMYWAPCLERIKAYNPKMKLIAVLRDPVQRAFSHWNMEYNRGEEKLLFSEAIRVEDERAKEVAPNQLRHTSYVDRGYYAKQVKKIQALFPKDQLLILKYEDFRANQQQELQKVFKFIGVDEQEIDVKNKVIHAREYQHELQDTDREYLLNLYKNDIRDLEQLLGWNCSDWLS